MSDYKTNLITLIPYGKNASVYKAKKDRYGRTVIRIKKNGKLYTYKFDKDAGVIL